MVIRIVLSAILLSASSISAQTAQMSTLASAERALVAALAVPDQDGAGKGGVKLIRQGGVGGFRFGMSRTEVSGVADCQPYTNVSRTGGIECPNYLFAGRKMNISFLFGGDELRRIQLWFYNGESERDASEALGAVLDHLKKVAGEARINGLPDGEVTPDAVIKMVNSAQLRPGGIIQVEILHAGNLRRRSVVRARGTASAWIRRDAVRRSAPVA